MSKKKKFNPCPKADRCIYGEECINNNDAYKAEYVCFEKKTKYNDPEQETKSDRRNFR